MDGWDGRRMYEWVAGWLVGWLIVLDNKSHIMAVDDAYVFPGFLTPDKHNFFFKATDYFSHMLQQKWGPAGWIVG